MTVILIIHWMSFICSPFLLLSLLFLSSLFLLLSLLTLLLSSLKPDSLAQSRDTLTPRKVIITSSSIINPLAFLQGTNVQRLESFRPPPEPTDEGAKVFKTPGLNLPAKCDRTIQCKVIISLTDNRSWHSIQSDGPSKRYDWQIYTLSRENEGNCKTVRLRTELRRP